ncbi:hypothetical protein [Ralstonia pseudosolanacearum]|uniref:Type III effector protein n=1 Tax=Ralstonia solanacearum TaxID=305 RepID=A0AA92QDY7_RALSL|nr:hypothetical protein [Ralstonia pseudosolanacearum]QOK99434.1 hypothetical protein HF909_24315 [Ralstonia pseudosolanacearum]UWD88977.1 hypothetical protein NY025_02305 [Ralstonia pseudosolanacearum]CAH0441665.1 hypothetical protein LMG9673_02469 [Ralstonia pseudosolanacearum]
MRTSLDRAGGLAPIPAHPQESTGHTPAKEHPPAGRAPVRAPSDLSNLSTLSAQSSRRSSGSLSISVSSRRPETDRLERDIEMSPALSSQSSTSSPDPLLGAHSQRSDSSLSQLRQAPASMQVSSIRSGASDALGGNSPPLPPTIHFAQDSHGVDIPNRIQLAEQLRDIFRPRFNGANDAQFEVLIQSRAERLNEMRETPASLAETLSKAVHQDRLAQATVGFLRSVPFGVASRVFDVKQALTAFARTPAQIGAVVGAGSGMADAFGGSLLTKATANTQWLATSVEHLEPVMAQSHRAMQPSLGRLGVEVSAAIQAYSARNVVRTGVAPLATYALGAATAANVDSWIAAVGGPVAGAAAYLAMQHMNETQHRTGAEYLLGRTDWEAQFRQLKQSTWTDPLKGAAKRAAKLPVDLLTETLAATRSLFTAANIIKNAGALGGGFAGVLTAQTAAGRMATNAGAREEAIVAFKRAIGTVLSAPVYAAWATADVMAGPIVDAAAGRIRQAFAPRPQAVPPAYTAIDLDIV